MLRFQVPGPGSPSSTKHPDLKLVYKETCNFYSKKIQAVGKNINRDKGEALEDRNFGGENHVFKKMGWGRISSKELLLHPCFK